MTCRNETYSSNNLYRITYQYSSQYNTYADVMNSVSRFVTFSLVAVVLAMSPLFISIAMSITILPDGIIYF